MGSLIYFIVRVVGGTIYEASTNLIGNRFRTSDENERKLNI